MKLVALLVVLVLAWRIFTGRWPWQPKLGVAGNRKAAGDRARNLLGLAPGAGRQEILEAHRRMVALVHPDRGGSNEQVHEANAARDILLAELSKPF